MKKYPVFVFLLFVLLSINVSYASLITFGGIVPGDSSGLTSPNLAPWVGTNMPPTSSGFFIETFDPDTANPDFPIGLLAGSDLANSLEQSIILSDGCSINSYGSVDITVESGSFGVLDTGVTNVGANPANDTTCFGYGPNGEYRPNGNVATIRIDYSAFLVALALLNPEFEGAKIDYIGLYYGSIDSYNDLHFFDGEIEITAITGSEILDENGHNGSWTEPGANVYVNVDFAPEEAFTAFEFRTDGIAFEMDNIVIGLTKRPDRIPEPASLLLFAFALLALVKIRKYS